MNRVVIHFLTIFSILISLSQPLGAEILQWVDDHGQTHYSDQKNKPPQVKHAKPVEVKPNVVEVQPGIKPGATIKRQRKPRKHAIMASPGSTRSSAASHKKCQSARKQLGRVQEQLRDGQAMTNQRRLHKREQVYNEQVDRHCP